VKKESIIFGSGIGLAVIGLPLNLNIQPLTPEEIYNLSRDDINKFDRGATYNWDTRADHVSDLLIITSLVSPALLTFSDEIRNDLSTILIMYLETLLLSESLAFLSKGITQRIRPYAYNEDVALDKKLSDDTKRSFYSSHTTKAFAVAVFVSTVYGDYFSESEWKPIIWGSSLLFASTIGYLRYKSGKHFPTDIITGAIIGSALGYFVPFIHRTNESDLDVSFGINGNGSTMNFFYKF
jgi:membrane-associated phospholipid phosphatase